LPQLPNCIRFIKSPKLPAALPAHSTADIMANVTELLRPNPPALDDDDDGMGKGEVEIGISMPFGLLLILGKDLTPVKGFPCK